MKKLYLGIGILGSLMSTMQAVKVKVVSSGELTERFTEKKFVKFMKETKIVSRLADQEMESDKITAIMHEELKKYLGDDYSPVTIEVLNTFGFLSRVLDVIGIPSEFQNIYMLTNNEVEE